MASTTPLPSPPPTTLSIAPSQSQTWQTHTINLFDLPATATPTLANPPTSNALTDFANYNPNFSKPVLGALLGGIIAIVLFVLILVVRRNLIRRQRMRMENSARSRAAVLQMQMNEAEGVTRRVVFGDIPGRSYV